MSGLGISYGLTDEQRDTFRDYARQIEASFGSPTALGALRERVESANLVTADRDDLLGRIEQYVLDHDNYAGKINPQEVIDDGAG